VSNIRSVFRSPGCHPVCHSESLITFCPLNRPYGFNDSYCGVLGRDRMSMRSRWLTIQWIEKTFVAVCIMTPCRLFGGYQKFEGTVGLHTMLWNTEAVSTSNSVKVINDDYCFVGLLACRPVEVYKRLEEIYCLHFQDSRVSQGSNKNITSSRWNSTDQATAACRRS
jgi:hypothetical protein